MVVRIYALYFAHLGFFGKWAGPWTRKGCQEMGVSAQNGKVQKGRSDIAKCSLCHGHALLLRESDGRVRDVNQCHLA